MFPISPYREFGAIKKGRFLKLSRQGIASYRGNHLGKVTACTTTAAWRWSCSVVSEQQW
jgi:hypothetical protein